MPNYLTPADYEAAYHKCTGSLIAKEPRNMMVQYLNDILRDKYDADDTTDTIPVRVVRRPTETVSEWPSVPHPTQPYMGRKGGEWDVVNGYGYACDDVDAWRSIDRRTGEVGPVIERTTTQQPRAWQAGDVPDANTVMLWQETGAPGFVYHRSVGADFIACQANERHATAIFILPERVP